MRRQDIQVDTIYGELETTDNLINKVIYDFLHLNEVTGLDNEQFCYGEVLVPGSFENKVKGIKSIHTHIPYIPQNKELLLRFRIDNQNSSTEYILNKTNNKHWFPIFIQSEEASLLSIKVCEYSRINEKGNFNLIFRDGYLLLYSASETDLQIKPALKQNEVFLLKAFAGNIYQYPTTGVGLIEFLHANFEHTGLAHKLQQEFESDKMIIQNAYMDSATGELCLEVKEKNG